MRYLLFSLLLGANAQAATIQVEAEAKYNGPVVNVIAHDATLEAYKQSYKFVKMLAQEETQRICEEEKEGQLASGFLCLEECNLKPYGMDFFEGQIVCKAKCQANCTIP